MMTDEERSIHAETVQLIAADILPKLVDLLQDIQPEYRQRTIDAAMILVRDTDNG
jgi:hypothetical protein